jgi:hypothetical protein
MVDDGQLEPEAGHLGRLIASRGLHGSACREEPALRKLADERLILGDVSKSAGSARPATGWSVATANRRVNAARSPGRRPACKLLN